MDQCVVVYGGIGIICWYINISKKIDTVEVVELPSVKIRCVNGTATLCCWLIIDQRQNATVGSAYLKIRSHCARCQRQYCRCQ